MFKSAISNKNRWGILPFLLKELTVWGQGGCPHLSLSLGPARSSLPRATVLCGSFGRFAAALLVLELTVLITQRQRRVCIK